MNTIEIVNYKGISEKIEIHIPNNNNLAIYGDNGSGKTSLFDAIRLWFFGQDLILPEISQNTLAPERASIIGAWLDKQQCKFGGDIDIRIDNTPLNVSNPTSIPTFMLKGSMLSYIEDIQLSKLISYKTCHAVGRISDVDCPVLIRRVKLILEKYFLDELDIQLSEHDPDLIKLVDHNRNIELTFDLHSSFNEAQIRIVRLLIFLEYARLYTENNPTADRKPLLVLDDFITSIDVVNRLNIMRYLMEKFTTFQIILLTHNVSYFNLIYYFTSEHNPQNTQWKFGNLFITDKTCVYYNYQNSEKTDDIRRDYLNHIDLNIISNRLRRRFEILVHEFSKHTLLDTHSRMKDMLTRLLEDKPIYMKKNGTGQFRYSEDLILEIKTRLNEDPTSSLEDVKAIIDAYDTSNILVTLRQWMRNAIMYQKIVMHQGSHQQGGRPTITHGEVMGTIGVLSKIEESLKEFQGDRNVYHV